MNVVPGTHSNVLTLGDSEPLLDIEQAARFLNVSETSLRRWTNAGRLACLRVGRRRERRFRKGDLLAFLEIEPAGSAPAGEPEVRAMHLCGLYSSDEGQVRQALEFLKDGFPAGSVTYLLFDDATRGRLLGALEGRHPALAADLADGRLVVSDYAPSVEAQLDWWESNLTAAVRSGATRLRAIGDAGRFARTASPEELDAYEHTWDERFATRFPLVSMCQYDVRVFSGPMILAALKAHPDCFQPHGERILA